MFTVKQLSRLAGVTPRTLHHYDAIGLLKPLKIGSNGYRYYGQEALIRLQQILFYRELDMPLDEIKKIMGRRDFDALGALNEHRQSLDRRISRLIQLIETVDKTINHLEGRKPMSDKDIFQGFSEQEQEKYAQEAEKLYDAETVRASMKKWKAYSKEEKEAIMDEGRRLYRDLIFVMPKGAASNEVQEVIARWHKNLEHFWTPNDDQLISLVDGYNSDPRFMEFFDKLHPGLAVFMHEAVNVYVVNRKN